MARTTAVSANVWFCSLARRCHPPHHARPREWRRPVRDSRHDSELRPCQRAQEVGIVPQRAALRCEKHVIDFSCSTIGSTRRHRAIGFDQSRKVRRLLLVGDTAGRHLEPRLLAPRPDVPGKPDPRRIVQRPRPHDCHGRAVLWQMHQTRPAIGTKHTLDPASAFRRPYPTARCALRHRKPIARDQHRRAERAARQPLALRAMARVDRRRCCRTLEANIPALTRAGKRQLHLLVFQAAKGLKQSYTALDAEAMVRVSRHCHPRFSRSCRAAGSSQHR